MRFKYLYVERKDGDTKSTEFFGLRDERRAGDPTIFVHLPSPYDTWWHVSEQKIVFSADVAYGSKTLELDIDGTVRMADGAFEIQPDGVLSAGSVPPARYRKYIAMAHSATMTLNVASYDTFKWTCSDDETIDTTGSPVNGQVIKLSITCGAIARTLSFSSAFKLRDGATTFPLTALRKHTMSFFFDSEAWVEIERLTLAS